MVALTESLTPDPPWSPWQMSSCCLLAYCYCLCRIFFFFSFFNLFYHWLKGIWENSTIEWIFSPAVLKHSIIYYTRAPNQSRKHLQSFRYCKHCSKYSYTSAPTGWVPWECKLSRSHSGTIQQWPLQRDMLRRPLALLPHPPAALEGPDPTSLLTQTGNQFPKATFELTSKSIF